MSFDMTVAKVLKKSPEYHFPQPAIFSLSSKIGFGVRFVIRSRVQNALGILSFLNEQLKLDSL